MEKDVILPTRAVWLDVEKGTLRIRPAQVLVLGQFREPLGPMKGYWQLTQTPVGTNLIVRALLCRDALRDVQTARMTPRRRIQVAV